MLRPALCAVLSTALLLVMALPAETAREPVDLSNASFGTLGRSVITARRLGRLRDTAGSQIDFGAGTTFAAVDLLDREVGGTYIARGRRGTRLIGTFDGTSIGVFEDILEETAEGLLADRGTGADVDATITRSSVRANVNRTGQRIVVRIAFRYTAVAPSIGRSTRGRYAIRLRGTRR